MPPPESPRTVSSVSVAGGKDRSAFVPLARWARNFWPAPLGIDGRERLRFIVGAVIGVLLTAWLSRWWAGPAASGPWMVASLGASAVLVFAVVSAATGFVSLGSIVASLALVAAVVFAQAPRAILVVAIAVVTLVIVRHSSNIARLRAGVEPRISVRNLRG